MPIHIDTSPTAEADPSLVAPLAGSFAYDDIEGGLKESVIEVFEAMIAGRAKEVNLYGSPHLASLSTVERFSKADGMSADRAGGREQFLPDLLRSWRARNPRRGLAFLRHYLRMAYAGGATVEQLWQDPALPYPEGCGPTPLAPNWFLTSRVRVSLRSASALSASEIARIRGVMLSILPARIVLEMFVLVGNGVERQISIGGVAHVAQSVSFTSVADMPAPPTGLGLSLGLSLG